MTHNTAILLAALRHIALVEFEHALRATNDRLKGMETREIHECWAAQIDDCPLLESLFHLEIEFAYEVNGEALSRIQSMRTFLIALLEYGNVSLVLDEMDGDDMEGFSALGPDAAVLVIALRHIDLDVFERALNSTIERLDAMKTHEIHECMSRHVSRCPLLGELFLLELDLAELGDGGTLSVVQPMRTFLVALLEYGCGSWDPVRADDDDWSGGCSFSGIN